MSGNTAATATPLALAEDANLPGRGLSFALRTETIATTSEADYWSFAGLAGDVIEVAVDTPGGALDPRVELRNAADGLLVGDDDGGPDNDAVINRFQLDVSGTYNVRVSGQRNTTGAYSMRVTSARDAQVESDASYANDGVAGANAVKKRRVGATVRGDIFGTVAYTSTPGGTRDVDVYALGDLNAGVRLQAGVALPTFSGLSPSVRVVNAAGVNVVDEDGNVANGAFAANVGVAGAYYAIVSAPGDSAPNASYLLQTTIADAVAPRVVGIARLPAEGGTTGAAVTSFAVTFDEAVDPAALGSTTPLPNVSLLGLGADGAVGGGDDRTFALSVSPAYDGTSTATVRVDDGALPSGRYRLVIAPGLTDVAGNALDGNGNGVGGDAFVRSFAVALSDGAVPEAGDNDDRARATPLPLVGRPGQPNVFDATGVGAIDPAVAGDYFSDQDWWRLDLVAGDKLSVAIDTPDGDADPYVELYRADGAYLQGDGSSGPGGDALLRYAVPTTGAYYVRVGKEYSSTVVGSYRLAAQVARGTVDLESDRGYDNDVPRADVADGVTLVVDGSTRRGRVAGSVMEAEGANADEDFYALGLLNAGNVVSLDLSAAAGATLVPLVAVVDATGKPLADADGDAFDGRFAATIAASGQYYALVAGYAVRNGHAYVQTWQRGDYNYTSWRDAQADGRALGGDLATVDDAAENAWLANPLGGSLGAFFIGINDLATEGTFAWSNGSTSAYRNWAPGEPNNGADYDGAYLNPSNGLWYDDYTLSPNASRRYGAIEVAGYAGAAVDTSGRPTTGRYVLAVNVADAVAPKIVGVANLPADNASTDALVGGFTVTFSEALRPETAVTPTLDVATRGDKAYALLDAMTWADAEAWATARGGHLVTVDDAAENEFLKTTFADATGGAAWIGLNDRAVEGAYVWADGSSAAYRNWAGGLPYSTTSDGYYDQAFLNVGNGAWYNYDYENASRPAIVEFSGAADADADGLPDVLDARPADALNGYALAGAGADDAFGTADDVKYALAVTYDAATVTATARIVDGPLVPGGRYRLIVTDGLVDLVGNRLDGDGNGVAGGNFTRTFTVLGLPPDTVFEGRGNGSRETAATLAIAEETSLGGGYYVTLADGVGSLDPADDEDWWAFDAQAGDRIAVFAEGSGGLRTYAQLYNPAGSYVAYDATGGPGNDSYLSHYVANAAGTYHVKLARNGGVATNGNYRVRVEIARGALQLESDAGYANDAPSASYADPFALAQNGGTRSGRIAGTLMAAEGANADEDFYALGRLDAGSRVTLDVRRVAGGARAPMVLVVDASGRAVADEDGNAFDGRFTGTIVAGGTYFALVASFVARGGHAYAQTWADPDVSPTAWRQARADARAAGGDLVTVDDAAENQWLVDTFGRLGAFFIGINDVAAEGAFGWSSGSAGAYRNWATGEPNNGAQYDGGYLDPADGRWHDDYTGPDGSAASFGNRRYGVIEVAGYAGPDTPAGQAAAMSGFGTYVLSATVGDALPPTVASVTGLPAKNASTSKLIGSFGVTFSEPMRAETVDSVRLDVATRGASAYVLLDSMTWSQAQAWASARGGRLVTVDDAAENAFLATHYGYAGNFWIGLNDRAVEGTYAWDGGGTSAYRNWAGGLPYETSSDGYYDQTFLDAAGGRWYNYDHESTQRRAVVEFAGASDGDSDGVPDVLDARPTDPLNGWSLVSAGADDAFGTADDVTYEPFATYDAATASATVRVLDGPLGPGRYRLTVTDGLLDASGNPLDGDANGTAGGAYTHVFTVGPLPANVVFEGRGNGSLQTAATLTLARATSLGGAAYDVTQSDGYGSIDPGDDEDWWRVDDVAAGDRLSVFVAAEDGLRTYVQLHDANGTYVAYNAGGGVGNDSFVSNYLARTAGPFYVRVALNGGSVTSASYRVRVEVARAGQGVETDANYANDAPRADVANAIDLVQSGGTRRGSVIGRVMAAENANADEDFYALGTLDAGNTISLNLRAAAPAGLVPLVAVVDATGRALADADGDAFDGRFAATIAASGQYYALVTGYAVRNGHAYVQTWQRGDSNEATWLAAQADGRALGGDLATVDDAAENAWLAQAFGRLNAFFIGMNDFAAEGAFAWSNGSTGTYRNWAPGEPNNGANYDATYLYAPDGLWYDDYTLAPNAYGRPGVLEVPGYGGAVASMTPAQAAAGAFGPYLLEVNIGDAVPPRVTGTARLPAEGASTDALIGSFGVTFSEPLRPATVESAAYDVALRGGHAYAALPADMTWADAEAWAAARGGHLVTIDDAAENEFLAQRFGTIGGGAFWIGLNDRAVEGSYVWAGGATSGFRNWAGGLPYSTTSDGYYDQAFLNVDNGAWYNYDHETTRRRAVVEFNAPADADADGLPDVLDDRPSDPLNGWRLVGAGVDGTFGTADDVAYQTLVAYDAAAVAANVVVADGPLGPGRYRLTVTGGLLDLVGNPLDGNGDGVGGDAFTRTFTINALGAGVVIEGRGNGSDATAAVLTPAEDPAGSGYRVARGRGSIDPDGDVDHWRFAAQAGDVVSVSVDTPLGDLQPYVQLYDAAGNQLAYDVYGGPDADAFISHLAIPANGDYFVRVFRYGGAIGDYSLRVDVARGVQLESDREYANDSVATANALALAAAGSSRTGSIAGTVMRGQGGSIDRDYFDLGTVAAGQTVLLSARLPLGSTLRPIIEIRNANNQVVSIATNPSEAVARADVGVAGRYYAVVLAAEGQGERGQYIVDAAIQPTSSLNFADLVVTQVNPVADARSGQQVNVSWRVGNYGAVATPQSSWTDRVVLSRNDRYGDADDVQLGLFQHSGALAVNATYDASGTFRLPVGISGTFYLLVATDAGQNVSEFIFESNNVTAAASTFEVAPAVFADLGVGGVTAPAVLVADEPVTVGWTVTNSGAAATNNGAADAPVTSWIDRLIVSANDQIGDADDRVLGEVAHNGSLAAGASYAGTFTGTLPAGLSLSNYRVFVVVDAGDAVYEGADAAANVTRTDPTPFVATRYVDFKPTAVTVTSAAPVSGGSLSLNYVVANNGIRGTAGLTWVDRVYLSADASFSAATDALLGTFDRNDDVAAGATYAKSVTVTLPDAAGTYYVFVVANADGRVNEYGRGGDDALSATPAVTIAERPLSDLRPTIDAATAAAAPGQPVVVDYTVRNAGPAAIRNATSDAIYLSADGTFDAGDTLLQSRGGASLPLAANGTYSGRFDVALPAGLAPGTYYLIVRADSGGAEREADESNNVAVRAITVATPPDLRPTQFGGTPASLSWGQSIAAAGTIRNAGASVASGAWSDRIWLSTDGVLDGNDRLLGTFASSAAPLAVNGQYQIAQSLETRADWNLPAGTYYLLLQTDALGQVAEGVAGELNNLLASAAFTIAASPLPDLTVVAASVRAAAGATPTSGRSVTLEWSERNVGTAAIGDASYTRVRVTRADTGAVVYDQARYYAAAANAGLSANGGTVARGATFELPDGPAGAGAFNVEVVADYYAQLFEGPAGSAAEANNAGSGTFTAALASYADLAVTGLSVTPAAPRSGGAVTVGFTLANAGAAPSGAFHYAVEVTNAAGQTVASSVVRFEAPIAANGGGAARTFTFNLPQGAAGVGTFDVRVRADVYGEVYEYKAGVADARANNVAQTSVTSTVADYAGLRVSGVTSGSASPRPGEQVLVTWTLTNNGTASVSGPIAERVSLSMDSAVGNDEFLRAVTFDGTLAPGASILRTAIVTVPAFAGGDRWLVVQTDSANDVYEADEADNAAASAAAINVPLGLSLTVDRTALVEGGAGATVTVLRNGPTDQPLTVTIANNRPLAVNAPATVTIPRGAATFTFTVTPTDDADVDGNTTATISASAAGRTAGSVTLDVADDDVNALTVQVSPDPFGEGDGANSVRVRVYRNTATASPLTVFLTSDDVNRLTLPASAVIPTGAAFVDVFASVIDNIYIDGVQTIDVTASAAGFVTGTDRAAFLDNDVPNLTLSLESSTIAENAGAYATQGTLTRSVASAVDLYVELSGGNGSLVFPTYVRIPAFQTRATFSLGALNDGEVSGDRTIVITARVVDSFTRTPVESGSATAAVRVTEDDGPALSVTALNPSIREDGTGTLRVRRNTGTGGNLTVTLTNGSPGQATLPASVVIPDGRQFVDVQISGVEDGVIDGAKNVTVTATAMGFGGGGAVVTVTDATLPDLIVTDVAAPAAGETGQTATVTYTVSNGGLAATAGGWTDRVYVNSRPVIDESATMIRQIVRTTPLGIGGSYTESVSFSLPNSVGGLYVIVVSDYVGGVEELREGNNAKASAQVDVRAAYAATVRADRDVYGSGQPVRLSGLATKLNGAPAANEFVKIVVSVGGLDRTITAFTAADGSYQATFQPLTTEAGNYVLAAMHPGVVGDGAAQDAFAILGMRSGGASLAVTPNVPVSQTLEVANRSSVPITGLRATALYVPDGVTVTPIVPGSLPGDGSIMLAFTVNATDAGAGSGQITIRLTGDDGATLDVPVYIDVVPLAASLVTTPGSLTDGMVRGQRKNVEFTVTNNGSAPSGALTVTLPAGATWMRLNSPGTLNSLAPGQTATVSLVLDAPADLPLQLYTGQIAINAANGAGRAVGYSFRALSSAIGSVRIAVVDDYTFYVEGAPKVAGATVKLSDPITGALIASAVADADGYATIPAVTEGAYQLEVYAPKHGTHRSRFDVKPGTVNERQVFIERQLVTYSWNVVPVDVEDTYKVKLEAKFETNVPVPVVTADDAMIIPLVVEDQWTEFTISLTNHGLIAARGVLLNLPKSNLFDIEAMVDEIGDIPAKTTIQVPVRIRGKTGMEQAQRAVVDYEQAVRTGGDVDAAMAAVRASCLEIDSGVPCMPKLPIDALYWFECGPDEQWRAVPIDLVPLCAAKEGYECLKEAWGTAKTLPSLGGDLSKAPCALIDLALQCLAKDWTDCQKALAKAACKGIVGAVTGGAAGAAAGLLGGAKDLLSCFCGIFDLFDFDLGDGTTGRRPPSWAGRGLPGGLGAFGGGTGGSFTTQGCSPSASGSSLLVPSAGGDAGVCATVTLQIEQKAVLTRTGFAGTFELVNGTSLTTLEGIRVEINVTDSEGKPANDKFGVRLPDVFGMGNVSGTGVLAGGQTGTARYLFVPTRDAAPDAPRVYHIGGTLRYLENGVEVVVPLLPATITVHPDPLLTLDYFLQRDVYSDDPFTDAVEKSEPFALGVQVSNTGAGTARNFKLISGQPKIIENEKGLLIDFKIIGTQVGDQAFSPSLTANFGRINAGASETALWRMTSTLQGHFIDYDASFEHVDDFGNTRTSLIEAVRFHELAHALKIDLAGEGFVDDGSYDFLANDVADPLGAPDRVYYSGGGSALVRNLAGATADGAATAGDLVVKVDVAGAADGWSYFNLVDPGANFVLKRVVRSDGTVLRVGDNAWTTDRVFGAEGKATYRALVHFLDHDSTGSYTLTYGKADEVAPSVVQFGPVAPDPRASAVDSITVRFSEALADGSFDTGDLTLARGGTPVPMNGVTIVKVDDVTYRIDGMTGLTGSAGDYTLSIDMAGVADRAENRGVGSATESWSTILASPVITSIGGEITPLVRNASVGSATITFSQAIDAGSFTLADLTLTRDGQAVALGSPTRIVQVSPTEFRIDALAGANAIDGAYVLTANAAGIADGAGVAGVGSASRAWTLDATSPTIVELETLATNPRNIAVLTLDVTFGEAIDVSSLDAGDVVLSRNGGADLFTSGLTVERIGDTFTYRLGGFTSLTGVQGNYTFSVIGSGIRDAAGNAAAGSAATTWTLDTAAPTAPANLAISPDRGTSSTDGLTNALSLVVSGTVAEAGLTVRLVDVTTGQQLGNAQVVGTAFSRAVTFASGGAHQVRVYAVDAAGNVSADALFDVFVDTTLPAVARIVGPAGVIAVPQSQVTVTFTEAIEAATFTTADLALTHDGAPVSLAGVTITRVDDRTFVVANLAQASGALGAYVLTVNAAGIGDAAGNVGAGAAKVSWTLAGAAASVGDSVWIDANYDGIRNADELAAADVTVRVFTAAGALVSTTTTDALGAYLFEGLDADARYYLEFVAPAGFGFTRADAANDAADSDAGPAGRTATFDVAVGANLTWDAGIVKLGSIGGIAYHDHDKDRTRDADEEVLAGWTAFVDLDRDNRRDAAEPSAVTGLDGAYRFDGLLPGTYVVAMEVPAGWEQTSPDAAGVSVNLHSADLKVTAGSGAAAATPDAPAAGGYSSAMRLVGLDKLRADSRFSGLDGRGQTVVIIDTGIDTRHAFFGPDADHDGVADRIVFQYDFGSGDADASDISGHGTHIASIIGSSDSGYRGMVDGVNFVVLKIFDNGGNAIFKQAERALQWVVNNTSLYNIVAVNMSFGDSRNWDWPDATECGCGNTVKRETYGLGDELATLRTMNVITSAAAGNNFYEVGGVEGMNYPAADPATISVGAVWDRARDGTWQFSGTAAIDYAAAPDRIAAFSQRQAGYLDVFAPGAIITGAKLGGGVTTMQGTSQATAFVTGAAVIAQQLAMQHLHRHLTLAEFRTLLQTSGATILDGDDEVDNVLNTGQAYARLDVYALAQAILAMNPAQTADHGTDPGTADPLGPNGQGYAYRISLAPGGSVLDADFGMRTALAPTLELGDADLKVVSGYVFNRTVAFADADLVDSWRVTVDYGDGSAPVTSVSALRQLELDHRYSTPGTYTITVTVVDDRGLSATDTMALRVLPAVNAIRVNHGESAQRSTVYGLSVDFDAAIDVKKVSPQLTLRGAGGLVSAYTMRQLDADTIAIDFNGGSLGDGVYDLTFMAIGFGAAFSSANGSTINFSFHRLAGDLDGDRDTDGQDVAAYRAVLNKPVTGPANDGFDLNQNGTIETADYNLARANVGKTFAYTSGPAVPIASSLADAVVAGVAGPAIVPPTSAPADAVIAGTTLPLTATFASVADRTAAAATAAATAPTVLDGELVAFGRPAAAATQAYAAALGPAGQTFSKKRIADEVFEV